MSFDKACVDFAFNKKIMRKDRQAGGDCRLNRLNYEFAKALFIVVIASSRVGLWTINFAIIES